MKVSPGDSGTSGCECVSGIFFASRPPVSAVFFNTEGSVREAMIQCLKGATLEGVRNLGDEASVEDILESLTGTFQGAAPFDTLLKNFFQLQQEDSEKVAQYSIKLESKLASFILRVDQ